MTTQTTTRAAYISSILAAWPPLTPQQQNAIGSLLGAGEGATVISAGPSEWEMAKWKELAEREDAIKAAKKLAESMTACDVCNLQPEVHHMRRGLGISMHEWQPGRAEKLMAK